MNKRNILILFIFSLVCIMYTVNNLCYKHLDNRIDTVFVQKQFKTTDYKTINTQLADKNVKILSEHSRLIITLSVACVFFIIFVYTGSIVSYLLMTLFLIAYFAAYKLGLNNYVWVNLISIPLTLILTKLYANTYIYLFKDNSDEKISKVLGKYISKDIRNKILKSKTDVVLGGKKAEITVMFADIRGFTSLSEKNTAEEVSKLLIEYFSELEPIITKHNGVINKFIGDAVLVIFGEPIQDKNHAKNAVKCAYELKMKVKQIKERWEQENKPKIDIGIGINTGEAFVGNVGTKDRFEYTVIGDTVNIASRIEDYNKIYKTHILISENTYNKISQLVDVIKIREVTIKGKAKKINIYEVLRITEE